MNFAQLDGTIWFDGEYMPWADAKVHVLTHTLHYGMGIYEGIRAYETDNGPALFRLQDHITRFFNSAKMIQMALPHTQDELFNVCVDVVKRNNLTAAYCRPMSFYGSEGMGLHADNLKSHTIIAAWKWGEYLGDGAMKKGIRIKTSSHQRIPGQSLLTKAKVNGHYVNSMLALQEAKDCGYDEALMLDSNGFVAEGSGENIFLVKDGKIYTPTTEAILPGFTRDSVIRICGDLGLQVEEKHLTRGDVYCADEAFFTGTAAEITPICECDSRSIGEGKPGDITKTIQKRYFDHVQGRMESRKEWLTYV
jgi:branched-chain amino acid aminotransferase